MVLVAETQFVVHIGASQKMIYAPGHGVVLATKAPANKDKCCKPLRFTICHSTLLDTKVQSTTET